MPTPYPPRLRRDVVAGVGAGPSIQIVRTSGSPWGVAQRVLRRLVGR